MLTARGIVVSHEAARQGGLKFGREIATRLRRRAPRRGDKWHLDEVALTIDRQQKALPVAGGPVRVNANETAGFGIQAR